MPSLKASWCFRVSQSFGSQVLLLTVSSLKPRCSILLISKRLWPPKPLALSVRLREILFLTLGCDGHRVLMVVLRLLAHRILPVLQALQTFLPERFTESPYLGRTPTRGLCLFQRSWKHSERLHVPSLKTVRFFWIPMMSMKVLKMPLSWAKKWKSVARSSVLSV